MMDRELVTRVIGLLKESGALELAVREGDGYVRARRAGPARLAHAPDPSPRTAVTPPVVEEPPALPPGDAVVAARLVGRFYHGKGPGQPPLVKIGDDVHAGQTIGTIEALGKLTTVIAPADGVVIQFETRDGQAVHYGTELIRLRARQE